MSGLGGQGDLDGLAYINCLDDLDGLGNLSGVGVYAQKPEVKLGRNKQTLFLHHLKS